MSIQHAGIVGATLLAAGVWAAAHTHGPTSGAREHVVLRAVPTSPSKLQPDVGVLADDIVARHGRQEWDAVVLTLELHRHLGIYAILGAKMGLAARGHFGVGLDELEVASYAGSQPPLSCLNDGLQASTGATLGHGTIRVADTQGSARPEAVFRHEGRSIRLTLEPQYADQVRRDVAHIRHVCGGLTPSYWKQVRALALQYWLRWSRDRLFTTTVE